MLGSGFGPLQYAMSITNDGCDRERGIISHITTHALCVIVASLQPFCSTVSSVLLITFFFSAQSVLSRTTKPLIFAMSALQVSRFLLCGFCLLLAFATILGKLSFCEQCLEFGSSVNQSPFVTALQQSSDFVQSFPYLTSVVALVFASVGFLFFYRTVTRPRDSGRKTNQGNQKAHRLLTSSHDDYRCKNNRAASKEDETPVNRALLSEMVEANEQARPAMALPRFRSYEAPTRSSSMRAGSSDSDTSFSTIKANSSTSPLSSPQSSDSSASTPRSSHPPRYWGSRSSSSISPRAFTTTPGNYIINLSPTRNRDAGDVPLPPSEDTPQRSERKHQARRNLDRS